MYLINNFDCLKIIIYKLTFTADGECAAQSRPPLCREHRPLERIFSIFCEAKCPVETQNTLATQYIIKQYK